MRGTIRTAMQFIWGLSLLGITAIVSRVAKNTFEDLLMNQVGPAVMALLRTFVYNIRGTFAGIFSGTRQSAPAQAAA